MSSTSTYNKVIVEVNNVSLAYKSHFYRSESFRDIFVRLFSSSSEDGPQYLEVLDNISFCVQSGERLGILGVNGAGKTSLCRCIAGIFRPTSGSISVNGRTRAIFDTSIGIFPELTGRENAMLLAQIMYPEEYSRHQEIVTNALDFSELGKFVDAPFKTYSNGMQARLCLSMTSVVPSDLLILDEVFDGADQFFRAKIGKRVVDLIKRSGAVIFVSHSMDQLAKVCNRVIFLHESKIAFDGPVNEAVRLFGLLGKHQLSDLLESAEL